MYFDNKLKIDFVFHTFHSVSSEECGEELHPTYI